MQRQIFTNMLSVFISVSPRNQISRMKDNLAGPLPLGLQRVTGSLWGISMGLGSVSDLRIVSGSLKAFHGGFWGLSGGLRRLRWFLGSLVIGNLRGFQEVSGGFRGISGGLKGFHGDSEGSEGVSWGSRKSSMFKRVSEKVKAVRKPPPEARYSPSGTFVPLDAFFHQLTILQPRDRP